MDLPNGRVLRIYVGNIAKLEADAIVSSDDIYVSMNGNLARSILDESGIAVLTDVMRYKVVRPGRAVVTSAGKLKARCVIHGIIGGRDMTSRNLISEIVDNCLHHADSFYLNSIAFPLFGTGAGGISMKVCIDTMFRQIIRTLHHGLTSVNEVYLVIYGC